jgi:hypothetical protein
MRALADVAQHGDHEQNEENENCSADYNEHACTPCACCFLASSPHKFWRDSLDDGIE